MHGEMRHKFKHGDMRGMHMHGDMKKGWMMMKFLKKYLTEEDMKELTVKKMDMKILQTEQKLEYLKLIRDKIEKNQIKKE